jgi:hypothetical protein
MSFPGYQLLTGAGIDKGLKWQGNVHDDKKRGQAKHDPRRKKTDP